MHPHFKQVASSPEPPYVEVQSHLPWGRDFDCELNAGWAWWIEVAAGELLREMPDHSLLFSASMRPSGLEPDLS